MQIHAVNQTIQEGYKGAFFTTGCRAESPINENKFSRSDILQVVFGADA